MPPYSTTEIKSGNHVYQEEEDATPRYVTLFEELDRVDLITPIAKAKKEASNKDSKSQADQTSDQKGPKTVATSAAPVVSHADLRYTSLRFDFQFAKRALNRAKENLDNKKLDKADAVLLALQAAGVMFEYDEVDLPLEQAADNLKLAEEEMRLGRHDTAKAALNAAADELKRYEESAGENRAKEVKQLHNEITKLTAALKKGKPTEADANKHAATISGLWHRVTKWFKGL